jgi:hypothetical protein
VTGAKDHGPGLIGLVLGRWVQCSARMPGPHLSQPGGLSDRGVYHQLDELVLTEACRPVLPSPRPALDLDLASRAIQGRAVQSQRGFHRSLP